MFFFQDDFILLNTCLKCDKIITIISCDCDLDLILKLNCYMDIAVDGEINPTPERIRAVMDKKYVYIMVGESMILSEPDDTHLTVFNPDWQLLELIKTLAAGEGLFVWKP